LRSPDPRSTAAILPALFRNEVRNLLTSRALWILLLILSPLVGYSFIQAVSLFGEASRSALQSAELARGMTPLDGILVPTFGGFYLVVTLLFPFVAIRAVGQEKQSGALKLALQSPVRVPTLVATKVLAVGLVWLIVLLPAASAVAAWRLLGGHLYGPEVAGLLFGHALYGLAVTAIAFFAAAVTESIATGAIVTLAFTIGSWVLDFAASGQVGWLAKLAPLSLTATLREFEHGLFASAGALRTLTFSLALLALSVVWLPPGTRLRAKLAISIAMLFAAALLVAGAGETRWYVELSEDQRNSFDPEDEAALRKIMAPLAITLYLSPDDSRAREMESDVLAKLRRAVPRLTIRYASVKAGPFGASGDDRYGVIVYEYAGKHEESRSNSPREILPILYGLADVTVKPGAVTIYPGYPLVAEPAAAAWWFYGALPGLILYGWWRTRGAAPAPRRSGQSQPREKQS
jgi:ABC-type transport system involved in multi-copper enzyme maturation permease subunit